MHTYVHIRIYTHIHIRMYASTCHYYYIFDNYICTHRAQVPYMCIQISIKTYH